MRERSKNKWEHENEIFGFLERGIYIYEGEGEINKTKHR